VRQLRIDTERVPFDVRDSPDELLGHDGQSMS
jgi:hypothetical protein